MPTQFPDHFQCQVVLQGPSGLPRDVFVNRFNFRNDAAFGNLTDAVNAIAGDVQDFYFGRNADGASVADYLSPLPKSPMLLKIYDLGQPAPRPLHLRQIDISVDPFRFHVGVAPTPLPLEVAACISWRTAINPPQPGQPGKRGRGRNYIGPLTTRCLSTNTVVPMLHPNFQRALAAAGARMADNAAMRLVVLSERYRQTDTVTGGWVDNEFDTQRRRGQKATNRVLFDATGVQAA